MRLAPSPRADPNTNRNAVPAAIGSRTSDQRRVSDLGLSDLGSDPRPADNLEREPAGRGASWERVVAATDPHYIGTIQMEINEEDRPWLYLTCSCGLGVSDYYEFTDHIRRITFDAIHSPA